MKNTINYWLYDGSRVLTAVRAPIGSSDGHVRYLAIASHDRVPLGSPEYAPFEFRAMLSRSDVRTFPGGN